MGKSVPLAVAIACGLVAALFYLSVLTGSPGALILVYLVQLPLFGAGLSLGVKAAAIASGTATVATIAAGGIASGALFLAAEAAPVMILVAQALRRLPSATGRAAWYPVGLLATSLVALGAAVLGGAFLLLAAHEGGFRGAVQALLSRELPMLLGGAGGSAEDAARRAADLAAAVEPFFPAMAVGSWLVMAAINGVLAQGALARFELNRRPSPDIAGLALPRWLAAPVVAAAILAFAEPGDLGYFGRNLVPVLGIAYVFAGLAVLHAALRRYPGRAFILVPSYMTLLLGWPVLLLAACGMIDQWFGLRQRFAAAPGQGEQ